MQTQTAWFAARVRALKLLKVCQGFCSVTGCMLEGVVLWQQDHHHHHHQQQQQQQQDECVLDTSHTGATALTLLARVLSQFAIEGVPVSQRIWEMEDEAVLKQPSVRMPGFVEQGDFIACRNEAKRVLRVLSALLEEVQAALRASSPPLPVQLAEWERKLEHVLTTSPDDDGSYSLCDTSNDV
ncbi:hypothetical protein FOA52_015385 [Chlamydomonas sp. UWO 241]|nr:hypothetical protein FOA52_015385 [Chlamydomonas sp. UWO 241]